MFKDLSFQTQKLWYNNFPPIGLRGIKKADRILKKYNAIGLLIGGTAKAIWGSMFDYSLLNQTHDVDVLVLNHNCKQHPRQWEGGIDWWVSHSPDDLASNGIVTLCYNICVDKQLAEKKLSSGLYLSHWVVLKCIIELEKKLLGKSGDFDVLAGKINKLPLPVFDIELLIFLMTNKKMPGGYHCKPISEDSFLFKNFCS